MLAHPPLSTLGYAQSIVISVARSAGRSGAFETAVHQAAKELAG
jgi:hypothetical protein